MSKKNLILAVVLVVIVAAAGVGYPMVKGYMIKKDPINYLIYASMQSDSEAVDASFSGSINLEDSVLEEMTAYMSSDPKAMSTFIRGIVQEVNYSGQVKLKMSVKEKTFKLYENISVNYSDNKLMSMELGYIDEQAFIRTPEIYDKAFVITKTDFYDLLKERTDVDLSKVEWGKYIDLLDVENEAEYKAILKNKALYEDILRKFLKDLKASGKTEVTLADGRTLKCDVLETTFNLENALDLYIDIFKAIKTDENVKALSKKKSLEFMNLLVSTEDYKLMGLELEDVQDVIDKLNNEFDANWTEMCDELILTYENMKTDMAVYGDMNISYEVKFAIDNKYKLRQYQMIANANGVLIDQTLVYNAYGQEVKFDEKFAADKTVSIKDMVEDYSYSDEVMSDFIQNGLSNYLGSDAVVNMLEDIKSKASVLPADEKTGIVDGIDYVLENKDMIINMMMGIY